MACVDIQHLRACHSRLVEVLACWVERIVNLVSTRARRATGTCDGHITVKVARRTGIAEAIHTIAAIAYSRYSGVRVTYGIDAVPGGALTPYSRRAEVVTIASHAY